MMDLNECRKTFALSRIGVNATGGGYLCEIWADDIKFLSERGRTPDTAIRKGLRLLAKKRRALAKAGAAFQKESREMVL